HKNTVLSKRLKSLTVWTVFLLFSPKNASIFWRGCSHERIIICAAVAAHHNYSLFTIHSSLHPDCVRMSDRLAHKYVFVLLPQHLGGLAGGARVLVEPKHG